MLDLLGSFKAGSAKSAAFKSCQACSNGRMGITSVVAVAASFGSNQVQEELEEGEVVAYQPQGQLESNYYLSSAAA